ncbi:MAG TPA: hypothetical protein VFT47_09980 [Vicinamibacterales bacterium]|nr:hypothetical protein [Vicinamibacterales bacterium]
MKPHQICQLVLAVLFAFSASVAAVDDCTMEEPLASLDDCITHHYEDGELATEGIYVGLLAKAVVAQRAAADGDDATAIRVLEAFVRQVNALSGLLVTGSAVHLAHHAEMAIAEIEAR